MFPLRDTIPSQRTPLVLWLLVAINVLFFVHELRMPEEGRELLFQRFGIVPARYGLEQLAFLSDPVTVVALVSSQFLHGGWLHLLGNLWTLLLFGDNVEDRMGHVRFLFFYLLCGVLAGLTHVAFHPDSTVPTIGASGAISGVMGAYLFLFPRARVVTLVPVIFYPLFVELPAFVFLGLWLVAQLLSGTQALGDTSQAGGIAFLAHVGGFAAGVVLHVLFVTGRARR